MNSIAQEARFRQWVVKFSSNKGVTEASKRFRLSRQAIYDWKKDMTEHGRALKKEVSAQIGRSADRRYGCQGYIAELSALSDRSCASGDISVWRNGA